MLQAIGEQWALNMRRIVTTENKVFDLEKAMKKAGEKAAIGMVTY